MNLYKISISRLFSLILLVLFVVGEAEAQAPPPAPVVVTKVKQEKLQKPITVVGAVEPVRRSLVASEIAGLVSEFSAEQGEFVKKGDLLAKFRTTPLEVRLREAKAAKREAEARLELARNNLARSQKLYDKGIISLHQFQDAQSERESLSGTISKLQAQIDTQEYNLSRSRITAPFNGYVAEEHTEVGEWVPEGGPVVELIELDTVEIEVDIPERYVDQIGVGDKASVKLDALPDLSVQGQVTSVVPQADRQARTFPVKVRVKNDNRRIKSGMVARVSFMAGKPSLVKLVPKDAVVNQNNGNIVFLVNNGTAKPVPIQTGVAVRNLIQITGPVETGQLVVIRGNERLRPDQPVKIVNQDGNPDG